MHPSDSSVVAFSDLKWLHGFAALLAADADDADDLVQETLIAVWAKPAADTESPLRPWLASVLRNRFRMLRRGRARRRQRERFGESTSVSAVRAEPEVERLEVLRILLAALEELPLADRTIVVRRFFDGERAAEIGRALGIPAATVRSRIHRTLKRLRGELDQQFGDRRTWAAALGFGPMGGAAPTSLSTSSAKGSAMSITMKIIITASIATTVTTAGWIASRSFSEEAESPPISAVTDDRATEEEPTPKAAWEARRTAIRRGVSATPETASKPEQPAPNTPMPVPFRELVNDCLDDLGSTASGALTLDVVEIGAPDTGVVYESIEVVGQTVDDPEVLQCIVESMYAFVGTPPAQHYESLTRVVMGVGRSNEADVKALRAFDFVIGAHLREVGVCQTKAEGPLEGEIATVITIGDDGLATRVQPEDTQLPPPVIDCIVAAVERWKFPDLLVGRTLRYEFRLPVREAIRP